MEKHLIAGPLKDMHLKLIPGGSFRMGSPNSEEGRAENEGPQHRVTVRSFYLMTTLINQDHWCTVLGLNPSSIRGDDLPVENISFNDVKRFIDALNRMTIKKLEATALSPEVFKPFRLPTEAEWEFACRAGTTTRFFFGDAMDDLDPGGWYRGNSNTTTHPSGVKKPNSWGLYDMHGNVWEWCEDNYRENYNLATGYATAWLEGDDNNRVVRGGCWYSMLDSCRSASRRKINIHLDPENIGFRLARDL